MLKKTSFALWEKPSGSSLQAGTILGKHTLAFVIFIVGSKLQNAPRRYTGSHSRIKRAI